MIDLHPKHMEAAYLLLCTIRPFCDYSLPHADDVEFHVVRDKKLLGWHVKRSNKDQTNIIAISHRGVGHLDSLMRVLGHEMIHLAQERSGTASRSMHNAEFHRMAKDVCDSLGWDLRQFV